MHRYGPSTNIAKAISAYPWEVVRFDDPNMDSCSVEATLVSLLCAELPVGIATAVVVVEMTVMLLATSLAVIVMIDAKIGRGILMGIMGG